MKLTITLEGKEENVILPIHHNHFIQGALYRLLDPVYASFLHQQGYTYEKRHFRLFSFSRLLGKYFTHQEEGKIIFTGPIKLVILTPLKPVSEGIINSLIMGRNFHIGSQLLSSTAVEVDYPEVTTEAVKVRTLSPIVCYSTMLRPDGRKFTYYFEPSESEFGRIIASNLYKKLKAWEPEHPAKEKDFSFCIQPVDSVKRRIIMYKETVVKGYSGQYILKGDPEYLQFALNVGLGSKGAQGFGAIEMVQDK